MIRRKLQKYLLVIISMTFLVSCQQDTASKQGVLSWNQIPLEQTEDTMKLLETNSINRLYQYVSSKTQVEAWESLFTTAKKKNISVYALAGDSAWSLDVDARRIKQEIDMIYQLDQKISTGSFQGIMFDVEPYLLEEWDSGKYEVMESYMHVMKVAYTYAKRYGYEVVLCIPYFLDEDFEEELDMLIPYCDEFVVMNYRKTKEWEQIETEVALSKKYEKPITILYELQPSGTHGLKEENTYYHDGIDKVKESYAKLTKQASGADMTYAYHDIDHLIELLKVDEK